MRIAYVVSENARWTGPRVYQAAVERTMSLSHEVLKVSGPAEKTADLFHVLDVKRISPGAWVKRDKPLLIDIHDHYWCRFVPYPCPDLPVRWMLQKLRKPHYLRWIEIADAVIVHSRAVADCIRHRSLHVVPYGIDPGFFIKKNDGQEDRQECLSPRLLLVGRDCFRKGLPVALAGLRILRARFPGISLTVIGDEFRHTRLAARAWAYGLPVEFLPGLPAERLREYYARSSVLLLPSYTEAFGIVLLEAMAAGLPVVASAVDGIPEAVEDGKTGLLCAKGNAAELAEKVTTILTDERMRARLVSSARESLAGRFDLAAMSQALERVYRAVLSDVRDITA